MSAPLQRFDSLQIPPRALVSAHVKIGVAWRAKRHDPFITDLHCHSLVPLSELNVVRNAMVMQIAREAGVLTHMAQVPRTSHAVMSASSHSRQRRTAAALPPSSTV